MKNCTCEFSESMFTLNSQLLTRFLAKLVLLGTFLLLPYLSNLETLASTVEQVGSLSHESIKDGFPSSAIQLRRISPNNLSNHDTRDNILLVQASTNVPAVKPVITIDYPKINTGYSPIVHNDDLIREGNPLRFDIKTLTQLRPNVDLNLRITQSSEYIKNKPTQVIPGQYLERDPESVPLSYEEEFTLTNESTVLPHLVGGFAYVSGHVLRTSAPLR